MKCNIKHKFGDTRCIRPNGHDGLCWGKACGNKDAGTLTRCEWSSRNGEFYSHHQYATTYPKNLRGGLQPC